MELSGGTSGRLSVWEQDGKDGLKGGWRTILSPYLFSVQCLFLNPASRGPCLPRRLCAREKLGTPYLLREMSHWMPARRGRSGSTDLASTSSPRTWCVFQTEHD